LAAAIQRLPQTHRDPKDSNDLGLVGSQVLGDNDSSNLIEKPYE
jgi:hypothetical protein